MTIFIRLITWMSGSNVNPREPGILVLIFRFSKSFCTFTQNLSPRKNLNYRAPTGSPTFYVEFLGIPWASVDNYQLTQSAVCRFASSQYGHLRNTLILTDSKSSQRPREIFGYNFWHSIENVTFSSTVFWRRERR